MSAPTITPELQAICDAAGVDAVKVHGALTSLVQMAELAPEIIKLAEEAMRMQKEFTPAFLSEEIRREVRAVLQRGPLTVNVGFTNG